MGRGRRNKLWQISKKKCKTKNWKGQNWERRRFRTGRDSRIMQSWTQRIFAAWIRI